METTSNDQKLYAAGVIAVAVGAAAFFLHLAMTSAPTPAPPAAPQPPTIAHWTYTSSLAPVSAKTVTKGCVEAANEIKLPDPPGYAKAKLCVQQDPDYAPDVWIELDGGSIVCAADALCSLDARYGQAKPVKVSAQRAFVMHSLVHLHDGPAAIRALKAHADATFALPIYRAGLQQLAFHTDGLQWPPPAAIVVQQPD